MTRRKVRRPFLAQHSLTIAVSTIWLVWLLLYWRSDPARHAGVFFGNSIADWLGALAIIVFTKYLHERGSAESKPTSRRWKNPVLDFLDEHSLTLVMVGTGGIWAWAFALSDPGGKLGEVLGNICSEWGQLLALVIMTKYFSEAGSKES
jgi:hypothetical protein